MRKTACFPGEQVARLRCQGCIGVSVQSADTLFLSIRPRMGRMKWKLSYLRGAFQQHIIRNEKNTA
ncbi:hypothetical protein ACKXGD_19390, partial [Enterococcus lactis]|uniref:hypothetical protein n=1 Tax=Enterococcus lactis TaxID=357441 RepID=UPI00390838D9